MQSCRLRRLWDVDLQHIRMIIGFATTLIYAGVSNTTKQWYIHEKMIEAATLLKEGFKGHSTWRWPLDKTRPAFMHMSASSGPQRLGLSPIS